MGFDIHVLGTDLESERGYKAYLEELLEQKAAEGSQSQAAIEKASEGYYDYIPFPYGLDPSQLAELLYVDPTHHACCVLKARGLMVGAWKLVRADGRSEEPPFSLRKYIEEVFDGSLEDVIFPAALDYEAIGNAYLEIIRRPDARYPNGQGPVARIVHVPAFSVRRLPPDHPTGCAYVQIVNGERVYFREFGAPEPTNLPEQGPVTELVHIRNLGGFSARNYWYGIPDILAALPYIFGAHKAIEFINKSFVAGGAPNYLLILPGAGSSPDALDYPTINRYFNEAMEKGPGRIVIIPTPPGVDDVRLEALTFGYRPGDILDYIRECRDTVARVHGVPLRLLSILSAGQLGSTTEAQAQIQVFEQYVIKPRQRMWEDLLYRLLIRDFPNRAWADWRIRFGDLSIDDVLRLAQADTLSVRFGILTPNEARQHRGLPPLAGGDEPLLLAGGEPLLLRDLVGSPGEEGKAKKPGLRIQSLIFDKERFTREEAARWAQEHGFVGKPPEEWGNNWRIRVMDPGLCEEDSFRTIELTEGVMATVCRPIVPLRTWAPAAGKSDCC